jgi:VIT1/CCC1 family predicted Fe2+/Mn2+ transporter
LQLRALRVVRGTADPQQGQRVIANALPPVVASILAPSELESMRLRLKELPEPPERAGWGKDDWLGALGVFLIVFVATLPVVLPFVFMREVRPAMRLSNAIAIALLFVTGYAFGRMTGRCPWAVGVSMVALGSVLVGLTMALGG